MSFNVIRSEMQKQGLWSSSLFTKFMGVSDEDFFNSIIKNVYINDLKFWESCAKNLGMTIENNAIVKDVPITELLEMTLKGSSLEQVKDYLNNKTLNMKNTYGVVVLSEIPYQTSINMYDLKKLIDGIEFGNHGVVEEAVNKMYDRYLAVSIAKNRELIHKETIKKINNLAKVAIENVYLNANEEVWELANKYGYSVEEIINKPSLITSKLNKKWVKEILDFDIKAMESEMAARQYKRVKELHRKYILVRPYVLQDEIMPFINRLDKESREILNYKLLVKEKNYDEFGCEIETLPFEECNNISKLIDKIKDRHFAYSELMGGIGDELKQVFDGLSYNNKICVDIIVGNKIKKAYENFKAGIIKDCKSLSENIDLVINELSNPVSDLEVIRNEEYGTRCNDDVANSLKAFKKFLTEEKIVEFCNKVRKVNIFNNVYSVWLNKLSTSTYDKKCEIDSQKNSLQCKKEDFGKDADVIDKYVVPANNKIKNLKTEPKKLINDLEYVYKSTSKEVAM